MALEVNPETAVTIRALAAATEAVTANVRKINETMDRCTPLYIYIFNLYLTIKIFE